MRARARLRASSIAAAAIALAITMTPVAAHAYSSPRLYAAPIHEGGGDGRYFTGSRSDGLTCGSCHGGGEALALEITGLPEPGWFPGATYMFDIAWAPSIEHAGLVVELSDASGLVVGDLSLPPDDLLTDDERCGSGTRAALASDLEDGRRVIAIGDCGAHRLRMQWRAPDSAAAGTVWLHLAGVRGDDSGDPEGDGPMVVVHQFEPVGPNGPTGATVEGCQIGEPDNNLIGLGLMLLVGMMLIRSRSRQHLRSAAGVVLGVSLICASGCARVQPWERGRLAQPDMLIDVGGDLLVGSQHAVEYREGSAGAVGGAGGGCGCN